MTSPIGGSRRRYPDGTVRAVLPTALVTPATRRALEARLRPVPSHAPVLTPDAQALLAAVCDMLVPQDGPERVDIAGIVHHALATGPGDGWRYDVLPGDVEAMAGGLAGLAASARALAGGVFADLDGAARAGVLDVVQAGRAPADGWAGVDQRRFFEELLARAVEAYYSHPLAQETIGYLGMADAQGWTGVGLGAQAAREPDEIAPRAVAP